MKRALRLASLIAFVPAMSALAADFHLSWEGRGEAISTSTRDAEALRASNTVKADLSVGSWRAYTEAFAEADATDAALVRKSDRSAWVQEAYIESKSENLFVRAGLQSLRWSESWSIPSIDFFTARRWNRLFFDPTENQYINPAGIRITFASPSLEVESFTGFSPAVDQLPQPLPDTKRETGFEHGLRGKVRVAGFDASVVYAYRSAIHNVGASLSFATEHFVPKIEAAYRKKNENFVTFGLDSFFGNWSFLPQFSVFRSPTFNQSKREYQVFAPLRWNLGKNAIEGQYFSNLQNEDRWIHLLVSRDLGTHHRVSAFVQKYSGRQGELFGLFQNMTFDAWLGGLRYQAFVDLF